MPSFFVGSILSATVTRVLLFKWPLSNSGLFS
jgi:hypothetical protein